MCSLICPAAIELMGVLRDRPPHRHKPSTRRARNARFELNFHSASNWKVQAQAGTMNSMDIWACVVHACSQEPAVSSYHHRAASQPCSSSKPPVQKNDEGCCWMGSLLKIFTFVKSNLELASRECWEFASTPKTSEMCLDPQIWNFQFPLAGSLPTFSHFFCIRTPRRAPTVHTTAYGWLKPYCPAYLSGLC